VLPSFPRILSELTPEEAHILEFILDRRGPAGGMNREGVDKEELCEALGLPPNSFLLRLQNLHRLQLIEQLTYSGSEPVRGWVQWGPGGHVGLTILGETLVHACRGPGQGAA
jgi:hypothetical protein